MILYELRAGIRPHEVGIPSNRRSARYGEIYLLGVLTARHGMEVHMPKSSVRLVQTIILIFKSRL
jgi:hypothetical protein